MKFEISSSAPYCKDDPEFEMLKEHGVVFEKYETGSENLYIKIGQTIEIEDLDELLTFCHEFGGRLVIDTGKSTSIEIYNDWRE